MGRKNIDRASEREQNNESLENVSGMETDRAERVMSAGSHGDAQAGDEGLDDPALSRGHRDDMTSQPMHGDSLRRGSEELAEESESESLEESDQRMASQRSQRTDKRANDERFDNADDFNGRGGQKEGSDQNAEGTGYTE
jgi:hypothetical protein